MEFCFSRASRSILITGTVALGLAATMAAPLATAQDAAAAGQAAAGKNYKDRAEYDLYAKITQTTDPKARLQLLNTWMDKYPQSDFAQDRLQYFVATLGQLAPTDASSRQNLLDKSAALLKADPKNFTANYYIVLWAPQVGGTNPSADLQGQLDSAAHAVIDGADTAFPASKKPANMSDADWTKAKNQVLGIAHSAMAYEASSKKDTATAENEYKASLAANPDQGRVSYLYAKMLQEDKKYAEALFEYARAGQYDGPDSVPAASRPQLLDYYKKVYGQFHGSADGADQVLSQAKTNALPPDGFKIEDAGKLADAQATELQSRINSDPQFKLWLEVKQSLTGDQADTFFNSSVKGTEIPGGARGIKSFSGTIISVDPADKPTKVVVGVEDPTKPDATLDFSTALTATAVNVGQKIEFAGIAESYTKDPYMLTFKDPTVPGMKGAAAPAHRTTAPRRRR